MMSLSMQNLLATGCALQVVPSSQYSSVTYPCMVTKRRHRNMTDDVAFAVFSGFMTTGAMVWLAPKFIGPRLFAIYWPPPPPPNTSHVCVVVCNSNCLIALNTCKLTDARAADAEPLSWESAIEGSHAKKTDDDCQCSPRRGEIWTATRHESLLFSEQYKSFKLTNKESTCVWWNNEDQFEVVKDTNGFTHDHLPIGIGAYWSLNYYVYFNFWSVAFNNQLECTALYWMNCFVYPPPPPPPHNLTIKLKDSTCYFFFSKLSITTVLFSALFIRFLISLSQEHRRKWMESRCTTVTVISTRLLIARTDWPCLVT